MPERRRAPSSVERQPVQEDPNAPVARAERAVKKAENSVQMMEVGRTFSEVAMAELLTRAAERLGDQVEKKANSHKLEVAKKILSALRKLKSDPSKYKISFHDSPLEEIRIRITALQPKPHATSLPTRETVHEFRVSDLMHQFSTAEWKEIVEGKRT